jgi:hypothetical protein
MILKMLHLVTVLKAPAEGDSRLRRLCRSPAKAASPEFSHANKAKSMKGADSKNTTKDTKFHKGIRLRRSA